MNKKAMIILLSLPPITAFLCHALTGNWWLRRVLVIIAGGEGPLSRSGLAGMGILIWGIAVQVIIYGVVSGLIAYYLSKKKRWLIFGWLEYVLLVIVLFIVTVKLGM